MAAIILTQTDTAAACGIRVACGAGATIGSLDWECDSGVGPGGTELTIAIANGLGNRTAVYFESQNSPTLPNRTNWNAGNYVVRFNVTTGHSDIRLRAVYVCKMSSACAGFVTVTSETGLDVKLGGGVVTRTINRGSDFTALATDRLYITVVVENTSAMFTRTLGVTPDQNIDTPIDDGAAGARRIFVVS